VKKKEKKEKRGRKKTWITSIFSPMFPTITFRLGNRFEDAAPKKE